MLLWVVMHIIWQWYALILALTGGWFILLSLSNILFFRLSRRKERWRDGPFMSVLIPARNEENRIRPTLDAILKQEYSSYEVIVVDDNSTDSTWDILKEYEQNYPNLQLIKGAALPEGWNGKPFAMKQLAAKAGGEFLVFLDADIVAAPDFLSWTAERMRRHKVDTMSGYAYHKAHSFLEQLFFPMMYLVGMTFLPFWLIKSTRLPLFSHAIGQLLVFRREAYDGCGGIDVVRDKILEDIQMGRVIKAAGYRHIFLDARKVLSGYMYDSWQHTVSGIKRSIYEYFDKKVYPMIILSIFMGAFLVLPPFLAVLAFIMKWPSSWMLFFGNLAVFLSWAITVYDRKQPWYVPFFYPFQFGFVLILAWKSFFDDVVGEGYNWKGRKVK